MIPRKTKRRLCGTALQKLRLHGAYHIANFCANLLEQSFWFFAQWRGHVADQIANERSDE
jgi:hypothetical protein